MTIDIDRRRLCAAGAALVLALLPQQVRAEGATVKIENFSFTPETLNIKPGTVVTWSNDDDIPHSIVTTNGKLHSRALDTADTFSFTFAEPGTYDYFCGLHPHMKGRIIVAP
ncbi:MULTISPECIES: cupredoxin family copper-binding protein [unclassified Beijerinckia]|uniref:cupredoxin domain-containing protein n=1 Tax=unclassified Beijerinckia TaxID=2638183 RepID=UPI0008971838|nr:MULTISPECIES: cupredoxin family copper-binding protein [unclassified Beijerinckia]MDH7796719.1 plastocyanin [Beijerinckia sp. GAS462]SEC57068.1 Plastocyanin [Beijerinckia sp. 28-YEA-48]